jgi:hypothetical protein
MWDLFLYNFALVISNMSLRVYGQCLALLFDLLVGGKK